MGRKHTNYRQYYKDYFGIDFGPEMAVHHIDFDRSNNNIENLLLMPKELHSRYHWYISSLGGAKTGMIDPDMKIDWNTYKSSALKGLGDTLEEAMDWIRVKSNMIRMKQVGVKFGEW